MRFLINEVAGTIDNRCHAQGDNHYTIFPTKPVAQLCYICSHGRIVNKSNVQSDQIGKHSYAMTRIIQT